MKDYLKKAVMALLVMTMIVMFFPNGKIRVQAEEKYSGEWRYTISSGEATLKEYFGTASSIIIPSFIDGYPVTEIGEKLFEDSSITNVTIPKSIEKLDIMHLQIVNILQVYILMLKIVMCIIFEI